MLTFFSLKLIFTNEMGSSLRFLSDLKVNFFLSEKENSLFKHQILLLFLFFFHLKFPFQYLFSCFFCSFSFLKLNSRWNYRYIFINVCSKWIYGEIIFDSILWIENMPFKLRKVWMKANFLFLVLLLQKVRVLFAEKLENWLKIITNRWILLLFVSKHNHWISEANEFLT